MNNSRRAAFVFFVVFGFFLVETISVARADSTSEAFSSTPGASQDVTLDRTGHQPR